MYTVDNTAIGRYVSSLIDVKYPTARSFCRKWLELIGEADDEVNIQNKANKLSQIKQGKKGIQIEDLPVFSDLLGVSCEKLLSAGKADAPAKVRQTNYSVAQSKDPQEWEAYIQREDKPILCKDEFGLNILEYALEYRNYEFIRYLVDKKYIWFDGREENQYVLNFGAGTKIPKISFEDRGNGFFVRTDPYMDDLAYKLATEDQLRVHILSLAAEHGDVAMLEELRARELPELYYKISAIGGYCSAGFKTKFDGKVMQHIARSGPEVLKYFTDPFTVRDRMKYKNGKKVKHTFIFPYISQLLDAMIACGSPYTGQILEKMIGYNQKVYETLTGHIHRATQSPQPYEYIAADNLRINDSVDMISFWDPYNDFGYVTNVAKVGKRSEKPAIQTLIESLNRSYHKVMELPAVHYPPKEG